MPSLLKRFTRNEMFQGRGGGRGAGGVVQKAQQSRQHVFRSHLPIITKQVMHNRTPHLTLRQTCYVQRAEPVIDYIYHLFGEAYPETAPGMLTSTIATRAKPAMRADREATCSSCLAFSSTSRLRSLTPRHQTCPARSGRYPPHTQTHANSFKDGHPIQTGSKNG